MKRTIAILMALAVLVTSAFAATDDGVYSGVTNRAYSPADTNYYDGLDYGLFSNPADFAKDRFRIQGLSFDVLSFNFSNAVQNRSTAEALSNITRFQWERKNWITYALGLLMEVGPGYNDVIMGDVGLGAQIGNYGFGFNASTDIKSMPKIKENGELDTDSQTAMGNGYVPTINYALSFGYGRRVVDTDALTLDVGATLHVSEKIYMLQINYDEVSALISRTKDFNSLKARGGFAFPIDLGVSLGLIGDRLTVNAMVNNLNGFYYMRNYENLQSAASFSNGTDPYVIYTPWRFGASVIFDPQFKAVNPVAAIEVADAISFFTKELKQERPMLELMKYLNASVKVDVYDILSIRAAYKYGYPEFGVGVGFMGSTFELVYGIHEAGSSYGNKPVDCLTMRIKLGFDR
ncbi:MAG: hypothetical protein IJ863_04545 [Spirochaetales bacterium]|nr:hypothetical protein [Spirochaetales bacterium]